MWVEQGARWGAEHTKSRPMVADDSAATRTRDDDSTCTCLGLHLVDILFGSAGDLEGGARISSGHEFCGCFIWRAGRS